MFSETSPWLLRSLLTYWETGKTGMKKRTLGAKGPKRDLHPALGWRGRGSGKIFRKREYFS